MKINNKILLAFSLLLIITISSIYKFRAFSKNYSFTTYQEKLSVNKLNNIKAKNIINAARFRLTKNDYIKSIVTINIYSDNNKILTKEVEVDKTKDFTYHFDNKSTNYDIEFITNNKDFYVEYFQYGTHNLLKETFFTGVLITIFLIGCYLINLFANKNIKIENVYLIMSLLVYGAFVLFMPLFTAHDEPAHWTRAYEISEGHMLSDKHDGEVKSKLPVGIINLYNEFFGSIKYKTLYESRVFRINSNERDFFDMRGASLYSPVQYTPHIVGIKVSEIFTNRALLVAYSARLFGTLFAILLIYFAIKIIPFGKGVLFTIAMFPMVIEGLTSISGDTMTNSVAMLLIAYILYLKYEKKVVLKKDKILITILSIVLSLCKIVYLPIVFINLILGHKLFKSKKDYLVFILGTIILSILVNFIWLKIAYSYLGIFSTTSMQINNILTNPFMYIGMIISTTFMNFNEYLFNMIGYELGYGSFVKISSVISFIFLLTLIYIAIKDENKIKIDNLTKYTMYFISFSVFILIYTSLYIQATSPDAVLINGIQGRYFIPILPIVTIPLFNKIDIKGINQNSNKVTYILVLLLSILTIFSLIIHFIG